MQGCQHTTWANDKVQQQPFQANCQNWQRRQANHIFQLNDLEWTLPTKITSVQAMRQALQEGTKIPGNVVIATVAADVDHLKDLCTAVQAKESFTILATDDGKEALQGTHARVAVKRRASRTFQLESVALHAVMHSQNSPGPWIKPATKVKILKPEAPEKITVRVIIPNHYRKLFSDKVDHERPGEILANLAASLGIPSHHLGGGQWRGETLRNKDQLVGYLKVCKATAEAMQKGSGSFGVFANMIQSNRRSEKIVWFKRSESEDDDHYFSRCLTDAKDKGFGLQTAYSPRDPTPKTDRG